MWPCWKGLLSLVDTKNASWVRVSSSVEEELGLSTVLVGVNKLIILFLLQGSNEGFRACFLHDAGFTGMHISLYALF